MEHVRQNMVMKRAYVGPDTPGPNASIATNCIAKITAFVKKIYSAMHDANAQKNLRAFDAKIARAKVFAAAMDNANFDRAVRVVTVMTAIGDGNAKRRDAPIIAKMAAHAPLMQPMTRSANACRIIQALSAKFIRSRNKFRLIVLNLYATMAVHVL